MKSEYIWMDGKLVPFEQATVHFLTPALHYGLAVFEGIRCYKTEKGPAVFRLKKHMDRLLMSIHAFGVQNFPYSSEELCNAVHQTIQANKFSSCYIRPLIYMADGLLSLNIDASRPAVGIAVWEWGSLLGEESASKGIKMIVSSFTRLHPNVNLTKAKISGNYANSVMAKTLATRLGADEAVMLDPEGFVAECTGENIFIVRDGKIHTPSRTTILEGITRDSIAVLSQDLGIEVIEESLTRDQLYIADEIFICGTAAEVIPVIEIDFRKIGDGQVGLITRKIQKSFSETIHGKGQRSEEWLSLVSMP